jgi:ribosomal-protein-alanine N-acetyltransferase
MEAIAETARLSLRRFDWDDLDVAARLLSDPQVMRFSLGAKTRDETTTWLKRCLSHYEKRGFGLWAVVHKSDGEVIGYCGLIPQVIDGQDEVELAYRLFPEYWGQGLGTEAARATREYCWTSLGLDRLISIIEPANVASIRVAEKHGMRLEKETLARERAVRIYTISKADIAPEV